MKTIFRSMSFVMALAIATPAYAQLNGENLLGDLGVKSGTQPEPGLYISSMYYRYGADSIKGPDGKSVTLDPTGAGSQTIQAGMPILLYVSRWKVFGANYGMMAVMPFANGSLEAPGLGLSEKASTGASDLYVLPFQLGWHLTRADVSAGVGFFAPTGRHTAGESDNLGKGMWSYELSGGSTFYLDRQRSFSIAANAAWETHSQKDGEVWIDHISIHDVKVGQLLTLEGGVGKSFMHGALSLGAAYYAQWKVTSDEMTVSPSVPLPAPSGRHQVWGIGPDVTIPIATGNTLISLVNVRYLWETNAQIKTQGQSFLVTTTFPVGGIRIPGR
jgi:hypothetical protein